MRTLAHILDVAQAAQLPLRRTSRASEYRSHCPFCHDDARHWHLYLSASKDAYYCHRCGAHGGVIQFYATLHELSFAQAKERLYPAGKTRKRHPAESLSPEDLKRLGFLSKPWVRPPHLSEREWQTYRQRCLDWIWSAWKDHETWERAFTERMERHFRACDERASLKHVE